jgi:uncharacterized protein (TIGR03067 family)
MRSIRFATLALLLGACCAAPAQDKDANAAEVKKLQGTWKITSGEFMGKTMTPKELGIDTIVIADTKMRLKNGDREVALYSFALFPDRKPKEMVWTKDGAKGGKLPAIYELDGTKLKLCFPLLMKTPLKEAPKPPASFETKGKPLGMLVAEKK